LRFLSSALKNIVFPVLSKSGYLRHAAGTGPAIVTYHGVLPARYESRNALLDGNLVSGDSLRKQLKLLKNRYHVITPEDFLSWAQEKLSLPPRSILLTCDDALRNTLTEMLPILQELGLSCLFFATGASADETSSMLWYEELYLMLLHANGAVSINLPDAGIRLNAIAPRERHGRWWNLVESLSQFDGQTRREFLHQIRCQLELPANWGEQFFRDASLAERFLMLDRAGLRQLSAAGMTIGAHTLSHPILSLVSEEMAWREISESRDLLETTLGKNVWAFGYPFGNAATVALRDTRLAERAGFRCAFMNVAGGFGAKVRRFALPRIHVTADMSVSEFEAHISGFYRSLRSRFMGEDELESLTGA
jgi:peptidoglycan/xylan/chitin deacetylase (PgdA/CDA1 family)